MIDFMMGQGTMITGVEDVGGETRVYVGPRWKWTYFVAQGEDIERVKHAWAQGGHVVMSLRDLPPLITDEQCLPLDAQKGKQS